jgi:hypothetical protein
MEMILGSPVDGWRRDNIKTDIVEILYENVD